MKPNLFFATRRPRIGYNRFRPSLTGFTLVELLVVITIIAILIALLLPAVQSAREAARKAQCMNNFKQVALALHLYHEQKNCFPPGMFDYRTLVAIERKTIDQCPPWFGWATFILPYIEQQNLYDQYGFAPYVSTSPYHVYNGYAASQGIHGRNYIVSAQFINCYQCPSDPQINTWVYVSASYQYGSHPDDDAGYTSMCAVASTASCFYSLSGVMCPKHYKDVDGIFGGNGAYSFHDIKDGSSNTLMIGEFAGKGYGSRIGAMWACNNMMYTSNGINGGTTSIGGTYPSSFYLSGFASYHPGGCHFAMADASVSFLSQHISATVLAALTTRNGGEIVPATEY